MEGLFFSGHARAFSLKPSAKSREVSAPSLQEEPEGSLTLPQAAALALAHNPELAAFSLEVRAAEARRLQAALYPNPEGRVEIEEFSGDRAGFRESETTVFLSQPILLGGKRSKRARHAELGRDLAAWDYRSKRLDVFTEVTRRFVILLGAQRRLSLAEGFVRIAGEVAGAVLDRVKAGAASPVEGMRAEAGLSSTKIELEQARRELSSARKVLASTWGSMDPKFKEGKGDLQSEGTLPSLFDLQKRMHQNPDVARWEVELALCRSALEVEKAKRIPDLALEAGYRRVGRENADTFAAGLSIPLPLFERNQGGIREAQARLAQAEEKKRAAIVQASAALAKAYESLAAASEEVRILKGEVIPKAQSAFAAIREGYRQGKFDYLDLLSAQKSFAEVHEQTADALVVFHLAKADVGRLIGEPFPIGEEISEPQKEIQQ